MRILHIVQLLACGGLERIILSMLDASFENTYIFILQGSEQESIKNWPLLEKYKAHLIFGDLERNGKISILRKLKKTCNQLSITVVHTHYTGPLLYGTLATLGKKNLIHIHTEHDAWHLLEKKYRTIEQMMFKLRSSIRLVAVSEQIRTKLASYFPYYPTTLIHNGINVEEYCPGNKQQARQNFNLPANVTLIGACGRLIPIKGHKFLIEAIEQMPEHFHLAIAGIGETFESLNKLAQTLNIKNRVHFCGFVEQSNHFYQACDIFCLPSINEGLPLALLEAQATNLPVVCTDVGGCKEALNPTTSILIKPENSQAIATACQNIAANNGKARDFIIKQFSLQAMLDKYTILYKGARC